MCQAFLLKSKFSKIIFSFPFPFLCKLIVIVFTFLAPFFWNSQNVKFPKYRMPYLNPIENSTQTIFQGGGPTLISIQHYRSWRFAIGVLSLQAPFALWGSLTAVKKTKGRRCTSSMGCASSCSTCQIEGRPKKRSRKHEGPV